MKYPVLSSSMIVADVLDRWPQTIPVFQRNKMACVGCPMAPFETLMEAAAIYQLSLAKFIEELQAVAYGSQKNGYYKNFKIL